MGNWKVRGHDRRGQEEGGEVPGPQPTSQGPGDSTWRGETRYTIKLCYLTY